MKKIIFLIIALFMVAFLPSVFAANWYVGVSNMGGGAGTSWATMHAISSFNWGQVQPGDTVYVDGGASGINYSLSSLTITTKGSSGNYITITKGVDAGHNGQVTFIKTSGAGPLLDLSTGLYYTIIDGFTMYGFASYTNDYAVIAFTGSPHDVTIQNCYIDIRNSYEGVRAESGASAVNIKILHNTIISTVRNTVGPSSDLLWLGGSGNKNWEIGWNNLITQTYSSSYHRDIIQFSNAWGTGGTTKIHDNFFDDRSGGNPGGGIESEDLRGNYEIYNNVFRSNSMNANGEGYFSLASLTSTASSSLKLYNNVFIARTKWVRPLFVVDFGNSIIKNNIFIIQATSDFSTPLTINDYTYNNAFSCDYNLYYFPGATLVNRGEYGGASYTFAQWQSKGYDLHSTFNTHSPTFVNINGDTVTNFALQNGSYGIDEGTSTAPTVMADIVGTPRPQGIAYDMGVFEYIVTQCSPADTNCDQCISLGEISTYVGRWLQGSVTLSQASSAVSAWMGGCQ